jgi:hypothetical protein
MVFLANFGSFGVLKEPAIILSTCVLLPRQHDMIYIIVKESEERLNTNNLKVANYCCEI